MEVQGAQRSPVEETTTRSVYGTSEARGEVESVQVPPPLRLGSDPDQVEVSAPAPVTPEQDQAQAELLKMGVTYPYGNSMSTPLP